MILNSALPLVERIPADETANRISELTRCANVIQMIIAISAEADRAGHAALYDQLTVIKIQLAVQLSSQ